MEPNWAGICANLQDRHSGFVIVCLKQLHTFTQPSFSETLFLTVTLEYRKVASSRLSQLVAHSRIFRLFMKWKFDADVLWPLAKRVQNWIHSRPVYCSQLYSTFFTFGYISIVVHLKFEFQISHSVPINWYNSFFFRKTILQIVSRDFTQSSDILTEVWVCWSVCLFVCLPLELFGTF